MKENASKNGRPPTLTKQKPVPAKATEKDPVKGLMFEPEKDSNREELLPCKICKRNFFPHRLEKHERFCKGKEFGNVRPKSAKDNKNIKLNALP